MMITSRPWILDFPNISYWGVSWLHIRQLPKGFVVRVGNYEFVFGEKESASIDYKYWHERVVFEKQLSFTLFFKETNLSPPIDLNYVPYYRAYDEWCAAKIADFHKQYIAHGN